MTIGASAKIRIGGDLPRHHLLELAALAHAANAVMGWNGPTFSSEHLRNDQPLVLASNEAADDAFDALEEFCQRQGLPYVRWFSGDQGFCPRLVVHAGTGTPREFPVNEIGEVMITLDRIRQLGSLEAIEADFAFADGTIPPFRIVRSD